ncbi:MAG: hypothetical protein IJH78_06155, partial [Clostridia bacterium]|nr:hypothetical protein [Clostridia bacterium]
SVSAPRARQSPSGPKRPISMGFNSPKSDCFSLYFLYLCIVFKVRSAPFCSGATNGILQLQAAFVNPFFCKPFGNIGDIPS